MESYYDVIKAGCKTMKKKRLCAMILPMAAGLLLGLELVCLADAVIVFFGGALTSVLFAGLWMMTTLAVGFAAKWRVKKLLAAVCAIPLSVSVILASGFACWKQFSRNAGYQVPVSERQELYGGRNVMVIVPHQDDELNILGGVLDEYVRHGSDVHVVIVTTGDRAGRVLTRHQEATAVCRSLGLPEDRVIFLGYGNEWRVDGPHIYNAQSGAVVESFMGRTATYAPEGFDCDNAITYEWNESREKNLYGHFNFYFGIARDTISKSSMLLYIMLLFLVSLLGNVLWTLLSPLLGM